MCYQIKDTVSLRGYCYAVDEEPLHSRGELPHFMLTHTANHRGYVSSWSIVGGKLFMTSLTGDAMDGSATGMAVVFPDASEPVFADWYSGTLTLKTDTVRDLESGTDLFDDFIVLDINNGRLLTDRKERRPVPIYRQYDTIMFRPIEELCDDSPEVSDKLESAGIKTIGDVAQLNIQDLMSLPNIDGNDLIKIQEHLESRGITLGTKLYNWAAVRAILDK